MVSHNRVPNAIKSSHAVFGLLANELLLCGRSCATSLVPMPNAWRYTNQFMLSCVLVTQLIQPVWWVSHQGHPC